MEETISFLNWGKYIWSLRVMQLSEKSNLVVAIADVLELNEWDEREKMADLPKEWLIPDLPPFTNVGVDFFAPVEVKRGHSIVIHYGVILTCMASWAVYLEVAYSLDTDSCINSLQRFICRRGQVSHMISENGTNFVGAERELKEMLSLWNQISKDNATERCPVEFQSSRRFTFWRSFGVYIFRMV